MSLMQWIAYFFGILIVVGGVARLPRIWRDDAPAMRRTAPAGWPLGPIAWRAYVRCFPSTLLICVTVLVALPVLNSVPERAARPLVLVVLIVSAFVLTTLMVVCVVLFNRPRFLVAPHLRKEPGAAAELRRSRPSRANRLR